jgi:hypothetical protein
VLQDRAIIPHESFRADQKCFVVIYMDGKRFNAHFLALEGEIQPHRNAQGDSLAPPALHLRRDVRDQASAPRFQAHQRSSCFG